MEWVETTGRTVEEALDAALDQLGVDEADAEYEVVEEPKVGLFGRTRGEARVRARVRPTKPRAKEERRDRKRRTSAAKGASATAAAAPSTEEPGDSDEGLDPLEDEGAVLSDAPDGGDRAPAGSGPRRRGGSSGDSAGGRGRGGGRSRSPSGQGGPSEGTDEGMSDTGLDVPLEEQGEIAAEFVRGVVERFGVEGSVTVRMVDEDTVEVAVEGEELGLLIGPKGGTLQSLQELARTVVQRKTSARNGRLLVDVAGYRQRRKEALERFARSAADQVLSSGTRAVLEPMIAADRKVLHDTINAIDGVSTTSEGEEPRRRVVILPDAAPAAGTSGGSDGDVEVD